MFYAEIGAWFAKQTLAFWLRVVGAVLILSILITPTCMYRGVKKDLDAANAVIEGYKEAAKRADKLEAKVVTKIEYKDKIIEKEVVKTKIKREYIYVNNEEARNWACTFVPDAAIGMSGEVSETSGSGASRARALPDYCLLQGNSGKTSD